MGNDPASILQTIDTATLTPVARRALKRDRFEIASWRATKLGGGMGNPVSGGLYRYEGNGHDGDETLSWSVVLKIVQSPANVGWSEMGEGDDQGHWNYWKRELFAYQSGLLEALPPGLAAPSCYGVTELEGNVALLWIEEIRGVTMPAWTLDRYAVAACHLGRLNSMHLSGPNLPEHPWFSRQVSRQWAAMPHWQTMPWDHPRVLARYPRPERNIFLQMLRGREPFLAALDRMPLGIAHGDTYPTNFVSREAANGEEETVALDWALMGIQPLGADLGQLVFGAHLNFPDARADEATELLFNSYLQGLQENGCRVDLQRIRFGFAATAALRVGLFQVLLLSWELGGATAPAAMPVEVPEPSECFEVTMAREACNLLESV